MKDTQTVAIVVLTLTAIVLGALVLSMPTEKAQAADSSRQGSYLATSVRATNSRELVYVINVPGQKVVVYGLDTAKNEIVPITAMDLRQAFGAMPGGRP